MTLKTTYQTLKMKLETRVPNIEKFLKFGTVGASGVVVNNGLLWLLHAYAGLGLVIASIIATECAIISNFIGNSIWTWREHSDGSWQRKFLTFQLVSLVAGALTVTLLWVFNVKFGIPLLIANTGAIVIVFVVNFALNSRFTWKATAPAAAQQRRSRQSARTSGPAQKQIRMHAFWIVIASAIVLLLALQPASALVSVSQMGFHPNGLKLATVYTSATSGTYVIADSAGNTYGGGNLTRPLDFNGVPVNCQGNNPCLVADFSNLSLPGVYHVVTSFGENSSDFPISASVYRDNAPLFNEYFDALRQQHSSYHADMNSGTDPNLPMMADGSFIMTSDQAALTLTRLSDAYRRNPVLLSSDKFNYAGPGTPDVVGNIITYANYLESLQDANILARSDGVGFRLDTTMKVENAFTPGPTNLTNLTVYIPDASHTVLDTVPMTSLCGSLSGTAYDSCVADAALYYKCQADEPCINVSYVGQTGTRLAGRKAGYGLPTGWAYEFGCFYDVDLQHGNFNTAPNPCIVYDRTETREPTVNALLAYTEAITPIYQYDRAKAQELLDRAVQTQQYMTATYPAFIAGDNDTGAWGAANFLLYDLTKNPAYLETAYGVRNIVNTVFISDSTRGEEFYWQEYIRHQAVLINTSHVYNVSNTDPSEFFRSKMYGDYYNGGDITKVSKTGERVYQFDPNIQFMNSRYQLTEGLLAAKTRDLSSDNAPLIGTIADSQLAWLTGNNGVQNDTSLNASIVSISFIFGIGHFPTQYHSRLLMSSGYAQASSGAVIGMRGTGYQFYNGSDYVYLDGKTTILGDTLGAQGNNYRNETQAPVFDATKTFTNGKSYIPGWINGAFDVNSDLDTIYNYWDNRNTYEFTESTNELVATAISFFAYRDAQYNNVAPLSVPDLSATQGSAIVNVTSVPVGANVWLDSTYKGMTTPLLNLSFNATAGQHNLLLTEAGCDNSTTPLNLAPGDSIFVNITLACATNSTGNGTNATNGTDPVILFTSSPSGANLTVDGNSSGVTPLSLNLTVGNHAVVLAKNGYLTINSTLNVTSGATVNYLLIPTNANTTLLSAFSNATLVNGTLTSFETADIGFTVQYSGNTTIQWYVDGALAKSTQSDRDTLVWTPDILYTSSSSNAHILAVGNGQVNASFDVTIQNYLNPFWGGPDVLGSPNALVQVFSNNNIRNFTNVIAELQDANGRHNVTLTYQISNTETDWKALLTNMPEGNTYIRKIFVFDNTTGFAQEVPVLQDRAHYVYPQGNPDKVDSSGGGGGGGVIPDDNRTPPQIVYAIFSKDIIKEGESIDLTADAKSITDITKIMAVVTDANGTTSKIPLALTKGSAGYGTWTAIINAPTPGKHTLVSMIITEKDRKNTSVSITDRSFYVVGAEVQSTEHLTLVYAIVDKNTVDLGKPVTLKLDARDYAGITSAVALLQDINGQNPDITVPLSLVSGSAKYGTWQGTVTLPQSDVTYAFTSVHLENGNESRDIHVYNQKVYVNYVKPVEQSLTGMATGGGFGGGKLSELVKNPSTPLFIGMVGMAIAMLIVSTMAIRKRE